MENGDYLYIQTSEPSYDYTLYGPDYKELDGGQLDNPDLSLAEAGKEILAAYELSAGKMEPLAGDRLDDFLEATEQANAISQPQAWNGINGLLNLEPRFEGNRITLSTACRPCGKTLDFRGLLPP
ncbi:LPD16 domain-containing protein [Hominisplanchenecus murintestinalis]|uniref:LPD16 domain-containing protein n=1 Tax=Hominisplanchenecus murintestinalis TaxID=2941517 RepID=UPI00269D96B4